MAIRQKHTKRMLFKIIVEPVFIRTCAFLVLPKIYHFG
jgi:hypothetical protein